MTYRRPQFPPSDFPGGSPRSRRMAIVRGPDVLPSRRELLYDLQGGLCYWCLRPITRGHETLEHLIPKSHKGNPLRSHRANFVVACLRCNNARGTVDMFVWARMCGVGIPQELIALIREREANHRP